MVKINRQTFYAAFFEVTGKDSVGPAEVRIHERLAVIRL